MIIAIKKLKFFEHARTVNTEDGHFKELCKSVKKLGIISPIIVRFVEGEYEVLDGVARVKAAERAGIEEVECKSIVISDYGAILYQTICNRHSRPLKPTELFLSYSRLVASIPEGTTIKEFAAEMGGTPIEIRKILKIDSDEWNDMPIQNAVLLARLAKKMKIHAELVRLGHSLHFEQFAPIIAKMEKDVKEKKKKK